MAPQRSPLSLVEFVALMATLTSLVALSIDAILPALSQIAVGLSVSDPLDMHLSIALFFLGMAIGQLIFGPLSDSQGRRTAILVGMAVYILGTLICWWADSLTALLIGRVIQAIGVSGPRIASIAMIRDQYAGDAMARVMSFIMMVFILVPMLAPIFGQAVMLAFGWRAIFVSFILIGALAALWLFVRQPETLTAEHRRPFSWHHLATMTQKIVSHPVVIAYTLAMGCIFGAFLAYLSATESIFAGLYDRAEHFPYYFATLAFSIGFASFVNSRLVMRWGMIRLSQLALFGQLVMSSVLLASCVYFNGLPPFALFMSLLFILFFFIGILFGNLNAMAMLPLGKVAGLGAALVGSISSAVSVLIALAIGYFFSSTFTPIAMGFVVFSVIAGALVQVGVIKHRGSGQQQVA